MSDIPSVLSKIKDEEVEYVDIRFTDPRGKLQHVTVLADEVDEDFMAEGFMFDGSSINGWKTIDKSDMKLMPDAASAYMDPFFAEKTICMHCDVLEPDTNEAYERDPRTTAKKRASLEENADFLALMATPVAKEQQSEGSAGDAPAAAVPEEDMAEELDDLLGDLEMVRIEAEDGSRRRRGR